MNRLTPALAMLLLTAACSGGTAGTAGTPTTSPTRVADPFTDLAPPRSPGVGSFPATTAQRAYDATQGLLASSLLEDGTLTGSGTAALVEVLTVPNAELAITQHLTPQPTATGLLLRPLFAKGVVITATQVVRSSYSADEVQGLEGEQALRISWTGAVRYRVTATGTPHEVAYSLNIAYVFATVPNEPGGLRLLQVVPGTSHAAPVATSCLTRGVLLPTAGVPSEADFGPGPWASAPTGPTCPV